MVRFYVVRRIVPRNNTSRRGIRNLGKTSAYENPGVLPELHTCQQRATYAVTTDERSLFYTRNILSA